MTDIPTMRTHSGHEHRIRRRGRAVVALTAGLAIGLTMTWAPGASAKPTQPTPSKSAKAAKNAAVDLNSDVREVSPGKTYSTKKLDLKSGKRVQSQVEAQATPPVGTVRQIIASDDYNGILYRKDYALRAVGEKIEVWVAVDTSFPAGDCRNAVANTTTVTDAQVAELVDEFDNNMFPKESAAFSVAPDRDGTNALITGDYTGDGDKIMTLVDNVRDDNYYEGVINAPTYIAGFFSGQFNDLLDRNVMTIDAFDWAHRTTANPPDAATSDPCTSRPARPLLYEGTFAHEYQHLLHHYTDPSEVNWVNEGLSDFAESLVGYGDATRTVFQSNSQSHIYCYQGFGTVLTPYNPNPRACGGPENSLTLWGDQGDGEILADYGEAWSFMLFLKDRYGLGFMSTLHRDGAHQGLVGLQRALDGYAAGTDAYTVLHDFQVSTLVDSLVDRSKGKVYGTQTKARVTSKSLNSSVNLGNPDSYAGPGAPANGADYVALRTGSGLYLKGKNLKSLTFTSPKTLAPQPLQWTTVSNDPDRPGNPVLFSGNSNNLDATAITPVTVPSGSPQLTFLAKYGAEEGYDYGYVVVSTDGGSTYKVIAGDKTVDGPLGPSLNGTTTGFEPHSFDLSAYAGQSILLGFRYVSDGGVNEGGLLIDDIKIGSTLISDGSSTAPFKSRTQVRPIPVAGWKVNLVGMDTSKHKVRIHSFTSANHSVTKGTLKKLRSYPRVVIVVAYDEPTEQFQTPAVYTLTANGVVQPGGGQQAGVAVKADRF